jgi:hypothetical protein
VDSGDAGAEDRSAVVEMNSNNSLSVGRECRGDNVCDVDANVTEVGDERGHAEVNVEIRGMVI